MPKILNVKDFSCRASNLIRANINEDQRMIRCIVISENPVMTIDWENWRIVREVVLMDGLEVPANRQVPMLNVHSAYDLNDLIGSIRNLQKENVDGVGMCLTGDAVFSSVAEDEWTKAREGHLTDISAGFRIYKQNTQVLEKGQTAVINGRTFNNNYEDGLALMIRTRSTLKEGSAVPIGADVFSKMQRSISDLTNEDLQELRVRLGIDMQIPSSPEPDKNNDQNRSENSQGSIQINNNRSSQMPELKPKTQEEILQEERVRVAAIETIADKFKNNYKKGQDGVRAAIQSGMSVEQFREDVMNNFNDNNPVDTPVTNLGLSENDYNKFSVTRALSAQLTGNWKGAEHERKIIDLTNERAATVLNKQPQGICLPSDIIGRQMMANLNKRAMNVASVGAGGALVGTSHLGGEFIEYLKATAITGQAGVRLLSGLRENLDIPKQTSTAVLSFNGEQAVSDPVDLTFGQLLISPKEGDASLQYTRRLLMQSNPSIDMLVMDDLLSAYRLGVDKAVLHGSGAANNPRGIANTTGVGDVSGVDLDWPAILEFKTKVKKANADKGTMKWIMEPEVESLCQQRSKSGDYPVFLMNEDGKMAGYQSLVSNQAEDHHLFFGDWAQLWLAEFGIVDIIVNPYQTNPKLIKVTIIVYVDVACRQPAAFAVADDVS